MRGVTRKDDLFIFEFYRFVFSGLVLVKWKLKVKRFGVPNIKDKYLEKTEGRNHVGQFKIYSFKTSGFLMVPGIIVRD